MDLISETSVPLTAPLETLAGEEQPPVSTWRRLGLTVQHQLETQWCWAAVSVSIDDFYRQPTPWTQCKMVCSEFGRDDCCVNGGSKDCNTPGYLYKALERIGIYAGFEPVPNPIPELPPNAVSDIEGGKPVGLQISWDGGGGHVMILEGFRSDRAMVALEDPWYGASELPATLLNRYQGTGTVTYLFRTRP